MRACDEFVTGRDLDSRDPERKCLRWCWAISSNYDYLPRFVRAEDGSFECYAHTMNREIASFAGSRQFLVAAKFTFG